MASRALPRWAGLLRLAVEAVWWTAVAGAVAAAAGGLAVLAAGVRLRISVPAFLTLPAYRLEGAAAGGRLGNVSGQVVLAGSAAAVLLALGVTTAGLGLVLVIVHQIRMLLRGLRAGRPFTPGAARRVSVIGVALVAGELLRAAVMLVGSWWIARHVHAAGLGFRAALPVDVEVIFAGLLLVAFAEVFRLGMRLQEDHDLTV